MLITELTRDELHKLVRVLSWNDGFGCYTRAGFEKFIWPEIVEQAKWIIYFDIDDMHALNEAHGGYEAVDAMIKSVLAMARTTDYMAGQWKSGDEFLICLAESEGRGANLDPQGMMKRLSDELQKHGLTATFAIVPVISTDLATNVKPAIDEVYATKKRLGKASR